MSYASDYWWNCCSRSHEGRIWLKEKYGWIFFSSGGDGKIYADSTIFLFWCNWMFTGKCFSSIRWSFCTEITNKKFAILFSRNCVWNWFSRENLSIKIFRGKKFNFNDQKKVMHMFDKRLGPVRLVVKCWKILRWWVSDVLKRVLCMWQIWIRLKNPIWIDNFFFGHMMLV